MERIKSLFLKHCEIKGRMNERAKITADKKKNSKHCAFILSLNGTAAICELILISSKEHHSLEHNPFYEIKKLPFLKAMHPHLMCIYAPSSIS